MQGWGSQESYSPCRGAGLIPHSPAGPPFVGRTGKYHAEFNISCHKCERCRPRHHTGPHCPSGSSEPIGGGGGGMAQVWGAVGRSMGCCGLGGGCSTPGRLCLDPFLLRQGEGPGLPPGGFRGAFPPHWHLRGLSLSPPLLPHSDWGLPRMRLWQALSCAVGVSWGTLDRYRGSGPSRLGVRDWGLPEKSQGDARSLTS